VVTDGIEVTSIFVDVKEFIKKIQYSKGDKLEIEFSLWDLQEVYVPTTVKRKSLDPNFTRTFLKGNLKRDSNRSSIFIQSVRPSKG